MKRRIDGSVAVSLAIHVVAGAFLLWLVSIPYPVRQLFKQTRPRTPGEQISYIAIPNRGEATSARSGGDGLPKRPEKPRQAEPLVAPLSTPSGIPAPPADQPREDVGGRGPLVARGGPVRGVEPSYADPRGWADPNAPILGLPRRLSDQLDSMLVTGTQRVRDSIALAQGQRRPGDWSWTKDGRKYGWDSLGIHLGGVTIPRELLALAGALAQVPAVSNPTVADRARAVRTMSEDINYNAPRAMNAEEFRTTVKRIRERKERERKEAKDANESREKKAEEVKASAVP